MESVVSVCGEFNNTAVILCRKTTGQKQTSCIMGSSSSPLAIVEGRGGKLQHRNAGALAAQHATTSGDKTADVSTAVAF